MKLCSKCRQSKPVSEFYTRKRRGRLKPTPECKACAKLRLGSARQASSNDEAKAERARLWRREYKRAAQVVRYDAHVKAFRRVLATREYKRKKWATAKGCLDGRMAVAVRKALRGRKAGRRWETLVGYSLTELFVHLERQFKPGMTWRNMGRWHIEHITPRSSFSYASSNDQEFKTCWALPNLRPLWAADNQKKHTRRLLLL